MKGAKTGSPYMLAALAFSLCTSLPASAQIVIGTDEPDVTVNLSVLDHLGPPPTLPDLLLNQHSAKPRAAIRAEEHAEQTVVYHRVGASQTQARIHSKPSAIKLASEKIEADAEETPKTHSVTAETAKPQVEKTPGETAAAKPPAPRTEVVKPEPGKVEQASNQPPAPPALANPPAIAKPSAPVAVKPAPVEPPLAPVATTAPAPSAPPAEGLPPSAPTSAPAVAAPTIVTPTIVTPAPQQLATAVPPPVHKAVNTGDVYHKGDVLTVVFPPDDVHLPNAAQGELTALAQRLSRDDSLSLQLVAFAQGDEANTSKARRLSLSRALEVRRVLMDLGVRSTRIEVRALGNKNDSDSPADRVDAVLTVH